MTPNTKLGQATHLRRCVLLVSLLAAGCAVGHGGTWVKASGQIQEQSRALEGFTGLEVGPGFTAEVMAGEAFAVVVRGDAAFLPHVETRVEHGSLVVRLSDRVGVRPRTLLSVAVRMPSVDRLGGHRLAGQPHRPVGQRDGPAGDDGQQAARPRRARPPPGADRR